MQHGQPSSARVGKFQPGAKHRVELGLASALALVLSAVACSDPPSIEGARSPESTGGAGGGAGGTAGVGASGGASAGGTVSGASGNASGGASVAGATTGGTSGAGPGGSAGAPTGGVSSGGSSGSGGSGLGGAAGGPGGAAPGGAGTGGKAGAGGSGVAGTGGTAPGDRGTKEGVCARWNADRADLSEGTWSGSVASCTAGDISANGRANALRLFNLYRWLADLPAVVTEASRDAQAQACSLLQEANKMSGLSHEPPNTWACWTQLGADGASSSNISGGPGVSSVDAYLIDNGNETTFGHRRIVLSNQLGPIGLGSTATGASCMQNLRGTGNAGKTWMAWPPPGIMPLQAIRPRRGSLDTTGWSVQSNTIDVTQATVTITAGGVSQPVTKTALTGSYGGARYAIRLVPNGWQSAAGQTYSVSLTGLSTPIAYDVVVVDCAQ